MRAEQVESFIKKLPVSVSVGGAVVSIINITPEISRAANTVMFAGALIASLPYLIDFLNNEISKHEKYH